MGFEDLLGNIEKGAGIDLGNLDIGNLLSSDFLQKFTKFGSIGDLLSKVGVGSPGELLGSVGQADEVVKQNSSFGGLMDMVNAAKGFLENK